MGGGGGVVEFDGRLDGLDAIGVAVQFAVRHRSSQRSEVSGRCAAPLHARAITGSIEIYIDTNSKILRRERRRA